MQSDETMEKEVDEMTEFPDLEGGAEGPEVQPETKEEPESGEKEEESQQTEETGSEEGLSDLERARREVEELRAQLDALAAERVKIEPPKIEPDPELAKLDPAALVDFVGELDLEELGSSKEAFNRVLNKVYQEALSLGRRLAVQDALMKVPDIVKHNLMQQMTLKAATDEFYETNPDLKPYRRVVAAIAEQLASANPDWDLGKLLGETEKEARKRLMLAKQAKAQEQTKTVPKPKFAKVPKGPAKQTKPQLDELQQQINDLLAEV